MNNFDKYQFDELFKYLHFSSIQKFSHNEYIKNILGRITPHENKEIYGFGLTQKDNKSFVDNGIEMLICEHNNIANKYHTFIDLCKYSEPDMVKLSLLDEKIDTNAYNKAFISCCEYGQLDVAKWLYSLDKKIDIHINKDEAFMRSCILGQLEVMKWLYSLDDEIQINIHTIIDDAFYDACHANHLGIAKWLYSLDKTMDIDFIGNDTFQCSCINGYLEMAQWLYSINVNTDIHTNNDEIFKDACNHGNLGTALWLYSLDKEYYNEHCTEYVKDTY